MAFWDGVFDVGAQVPGRADESLLVDAAAMDFVRRPETFDVVVAIESVRRHPDRPGRRDHR